MLAKVLTCAVVGLDGEMVEVEVDIGQGLPAFHIVGMGDKAIQEAKERVRAAIKNSGCEFPNRRPYPSDHGILDEAIIRALADAADLLEVEP